MGRVVEGAGGGGGERRHALRGRRAVGLAVVGLEDLVGRLDHADARLGQTARAARLLSVYILKVGTNF